MAAGLKKAVGHPYDELDRWVGLELAVGVALFTACTVGFRATLGLGISRERLLAAGAALATIPLGLYWSALASSSRSRRLSLPRLFWRHAASRRS